MLFTKLVALGSSLSLAPAVVIAAAAAVSERATTPCTLTAAGAGKDDAPSLVSAMQSCATVTVAAGTTLNISSKMNMTGLSNRHLSVQGTLKFNPNIKYWSGNSFSFAFQTQAAWWLLGGTNFVVDGGGTIDGSGQVWYDAFASNSSLIRPILFTLSGAHGAIIDNIKLINSPEWFIFVTDSNNVTFNNMNLNAVSTSKNPAKNTDGWDVYRSDSVVIENSNVNNGDDCFSAKPNVTNVLISNLACNGSHGISIGSLGQYPGVYDIVENVTAVNVRMSNAENGARIKAFAGSGVGSGIVKNITFSGFVETNVDNPVIIDQCYETSASDCDKYPSNVYISDIVFNNITGTSSTKEKGVVASLDCSPGSRCSGITVSGLTLQAPSSKKYNTTYECENTSLSGSSANLFGACAST